MSYRLATLISYVAILALGVVYSISIFRMKGADMGGIGPKYFPALLAGSLIMLSLAGIIRTVAGQKEDKRIEMPNLAMILATAGATAAFIWLWQMTGRFYLLSFLLIFGLMNLYKPFWKSGIRRLALYALIAALLLLFFHLVFARLMGLRL